MVDPIQRFQEIICSLYFVLNPVRCPRMSSKYSFLTEMKFFASIW